MNRDLSKLNEQQREAVMHTEGPLLVLAGAGSGKTTVLTERIAQIIAQGTRPWAILAITFTNKAAGEMKERLHKRLGKDGLDVWASTFHSCCVRFLRMDIEKLPKASYTKSFTIYDMDDCKRVVKEILKARNLDDKHFPPKMILSAISKAKDAQLSPQEFAVKVGRDYMLERVAVCYADYQKKLQESNAVDFDDIIMLTVKLFKECPEVLEFYQKKFSYVLVDEYQDTNTLQYELVAMLSAKHQNLCVVGDDDQSIYKFRGATIENILNFEKQFKGAHTIRLEQNYRSTGNILAAANQVISNNRGRKGKTLWTGNSQGENVAFYAGYSESDEARYVADTIMEGVRAGRKFKDFCMLYRMNSLSRTLEHALKLCGVPYRILGGVRFFDRAEVKDMLAYLQVINNPSDDLRLMRIVNNPARDIGDKTISVVQALATRDGTSMFEVMKHAREYPELGKKAKALEGFTFMIETFIAALQDEETPIKLSEFYDMVVRNTGYFAQYAESKDIDAQGRIENMMELKSNIAEFEQNMEVSPTLSGFLDEVSLFTDIDRFDEEADACVMMTIHSAKGLEFPVVFVVGVEENILPGAQSMAEESEVEEERRLCYVAVTRAREKLHITCARERMLYGKTSSSQVSRFVKEMKLAYELPSQSPRERISDVTATQRFAVGSAPSQGYPSVKAAPSPQSKLFSSTPVSSGGAKNADLLSLSKGEMVSHKSFGRGMVVSLTPMGGDALVEIAFDTVGTKRLMLKSAQSFIKKESAL